MAQLALAGVQAFMQIRSANAQAKSIKAAGRAQQQAAEHRAAQLNINAGQERAASQRGAIEARRRGRIAESNAIAAGAAGGGSTSDYADILGELGAYSEYSALNSIYEGEDAARLLESQADMSIYDGQAAMTSARNQAKNIKTEGYGKAISGFAGSSAGQSLFSKYGGDTHIDWNQGGRTYL